MGTDAIQGIGLPREDMQRSGATNGGSSSSLDAIKQQVIGLAQQIGITPLEMGNFKAQQTGGNRTLGIA
jgi:hypothetical protein